MVYDSFVGYNTRQKPSRDSFPLLEVEYRLVGWLVGSVTWMDIVLLCFLLRLVIFLRQMGAFMAWQFHCEPNLSFPRRASSNRIGRVVKCNAGENNKAENQLVSHMRTSLYRSISNKQRTWISLNLPWGLPDRRACTCSGPTSWSKRWSRLPKEQKSW